MKILRVEDATFARGGVTLVEHFSIGVACGERAVLHQPTSDAAAIAARIVAGIVKPTTGRVYIGDYDARLQPAQAKRLVGFVPAAGFTGSERAFARSVAFRADVWDIDARMARRRADDVVRALGGSLDGYVWAVALALIPTIALLVLDRPPPALLDAVAELAPPAALVALFAGERASAVTRSAAFAQSAG
jgi:ABC-type Na+ transport system ATPase subunit NatA